MSEYIERVSKIPQSAVAGDPDQTTAFSSNTFLDREITTKNAVLIGAATLYTKRIASQIGGALLRQTGNARYERFANIAGKGIGYVATGLVSVPLAVGAAVVDTGLAGLQALEERQEIQFENERKVSERGGNTSLGNAYD